MDAVKAQSRTVPKIPRTLKNKNDPKTKVVDHDTQVVEDLKKLYLETIRVDVDMQREIYNLEKMFEMKHNEIFEKRYKILEEHRKKTTGAGATAGVDSINNFWLRVLKASYTEFISKKDEKILVHLTDIRSKLCNDPVVKFVIEFLFEPNEYFSNRKLTKTYYLNCLPDVDDPLAYDGAEIFKCEGCKIDWKIDPEVDTDMKKGLAFSSFFDFFKPPTLPEKQEDASFNEINAILQNDFELGFYLKERVIPKAVMFYTGEIADCQTSESESDDTEDCDAEEEESSEAEEAEN